MGQSNKRGGYRFETYRVHRRVESIPLDGSHVVYLVRLLAGMRCLRKGNTYLFASILLKTNEIDCVALSSNNILREDGVGDKSFAEIYIAQIYASQIGTVQVCPFETYFTEGIVIYLRNFTLHHAV